MIKNFLSEIVIAVIILGLLVILINPAGFFMATALEMMVTVGLVLLFGVFSLLVWRERAADERDVMLRMMADRMGFLAGSSVLVVAIVVESLRHQLSDWLLVALAAMVIAKIIGLIYGKSKF